MGGVVTDTPFVHRGTQSYLSAVWPLSFLVTLLEAANVPRGRKAPVVGLTSLNAHFLPHLSLAVFRYLLNFLTLSG